MNIILNDGAACCCLIFEGAMTHRFLRTMEDRIIDCMRRYPQIDVDLTGVSEIDVYGARLLAVLRGFGEEVIRIVAASPVVEAALSQIPRTPAPRRSCGQGKVTSTSEHPPLDRLHASAFAA